ALARQAGLLSPHVGREWGGLGLDHRGKAVVFEAAGYAPLATIAMNIFAPDEANMHLLEQVADQQQKEEWLRPLAAGDIRSCFMMTEPPPGAGADPSMLLTTARRAESSNSGDFVIDGTKWLITGAVGEGFRYAQARLAPARLTHCMRWLGAARRAHDIATDYARRRTAFGKPLGEHEGVGFMLADNEMDLHTSRLTIWHTAWLLDQGERARHESSMAKVICSEAIWRVVDRSMQVLGGLG